MRRPLLQYGPTVACTKVYARHSAAKGQDWYTRMAFCTALVASRGSQSGTQIDGPCPL